MNLKKVLSSFCLLVAASASAQLNGDGFYRVQNYMTERYIHVIDDKGSINLTTTTADLYAITLWKGFERSVSNPASVIYIKNVGGTQYDLQAQGTGVYAIISHYVSLKKLNDGTYFAYASESGFTKYLADARHSDADQGYLTGEGYDDWRKWYIKPINQEEGYYFGVQSDFTVGGSHYASFYASFPFSFASSGMKAYTISRVGGDMAVMKEVTTDIIPGATPLIISCASESPADNKLNLIASNAKAPSGNLLGGVYFNNPAKSHYNQVAYDPATMRVLGVTKDGSIGFVTADIDYLPANKAYLKVPAGSPEELRMVTEDEFTAGIDDVRLDNAVQAKGVYTLTGVKVRDNATSLDGLAAGVYIVSGKKVVVK